MSKQISGYDAYELFLHTLNSKPVTVREIALCRAFFQAAWEAKEVELSASQAREAELREKLGTAEADARFNRAKFEGTVQACAQISGEAKAWKQRAEAAEALNSLQAQSIRMLSKELEAAEARIKELEGQLTK